jgi:copper(I)-binding protein
MKKRFWAAAAVGLAVAGLAACSETSAPTEAAPEGPAGISVSNARLMLPAVSGNPGALYFEVKNDGEKNRMIRLVEIAGAGSAMMHSAEMFELPQVPVPAGETASFAPGEKHVMAMDLADTVTAGSTAEVTLTFVGGDKLSFPAEVRAAGDER